MRRGAILLAVAGLAVWSPAASADGGQRTITIKARSQVERAHLVDNAPAGRSVGDVLVFTERLYDLQGRRIGDDAATCVSLFDETWLCTGTYRLPGGRLMVPAAPAWARGGLQPGDRRRDRALRRRGAGR